MLIRVPFRGNASQASALGQMPVDSGAFAERSDGGDSDEGQPVLCPTEGKTSPFSVRNVLCQREERALSAGGTCSIER